KLGRMLLPYALISLLISSFWLPLWPAVLVLAAQAGIYGAALADPILPDRSLLKRISSPARTFVVLMAAATAALAIFFVPAGKLWRPAAQPERARGVNQPTGSVP
ncbi:MAG TPA: hypothetical protein VHB50_05860, partial [Bryobacteraceae bacterium]|nr:hypothetical protein [Bryobacteraceae bacterium]